jgi:hypothetical protein
MSVKKCINNDLNLNIIGFNNFLSDLLNDEFSNNIKTIKLLNNYQELSKLKFKNNDHIIKYIDNELNKYVYKNTTTIFNSDADINYIIKQVVFIEKKNYFEIIRELNIDHIINILDYGTNNKNYNRDIKKKYYENIYNIIINNNNNDINLISLLDKNWNNINFKNLYDLIVIIHNNFVMNNIEINEINELLSTKFDCLESIKKLLDFIKDTFIEINSMNDNDYITNYDNNINDDNLLKCKKYNLSTLILSLKSNGFLLFQEYEKDIIKRYGNIYNSCNQNYILNLNNDINLLNYFIYVISINKNNIVNRYVNDMLIRIKGYLKDLNESYYNNLVFYKIKVRCISEKYNNFDINSFKRNIASFKILKYNNANIDEESNVNKDNNAISINEKLYPYYDIYTSFYKARYPDRKISFDLNRSTLIIEVCINNKTYFIHLAIIQFILLDTILSNKNGISHTDIQLKTGIKLKKLNDSFNSLLKIKLIKKNVSNNLFFINENFEFNSNEKNKFSIANLVNIQNNKNIIKEKQFMHDKKTIIQCNVIYYAKKNVMFTIDVLYNKMTYVIPFKFTNEELVDCINKCVDEDYLIEKSLEGSKYYQYSELFD